MITGRAIVEARGGRWDERRRSGRCRCPAHDDDSPSLDVTERNGKVLFICRAGCSQAAVIEGFRACGLWPNREDHPPPRRSKAMPPLSNSSAPDFQALFKTEPSAFWDYCAVDGSLLGYTARIETSDGKKVIPVTFDGKVWVLKGFPEPHPLYGLPALAERPADPVLVTEGEKTAWRLRRSLRATSLSAGRVARRRSSGRTGHRLPDAG